MAKSQKPGLLSELDKTVSDMMFDPRIEKIIEEIRKDERSRIVRKIHATAEEIVKEMAGQHPIRVNQANFAADVLRTMADQIESNPQQEEQDDAQET